MNTIFNLLHSFWGRIYSPKTNINIISVTSNQCTTPARTQFKQVQSTDMMPVHESRFVSFGYGRGYYAPSTRFEYKIKYDTKMEYTPPITSYLVQVSYTEYSKLLDIKTMNLFCSSLTRRDELTTYFENNKESQIRFLLGCPIITDIQYNWWMENPYTFPLIVATPIFACAMIYIKWFI